MPATKADLVIHPVRLRIIQALFGGTHLTACQISERLPDVPMASLYRHLSQLVAGGVLTVVAERPVRGTVEKVYALVEHAANVGPAEYGRQTNEDHLRYFRMFLLLLLGDFQRYLAQHEQADLAADGVLYYQLPFYLSDEEFKQLIETLKTTLAPARANQPAPQRQRRLLSILAVPGADVPPALRPPTEAGER